MSSEMASWREMIEGEMKDDDCWANIERSTLTEDELHREFYTGYGSPQGKPFLLWTTDYVYFPITYDGAEWVGRVPRNAMDATMPKELDHFGGG